MHPVAEQLLEQHIEFELDALTDQRVQPFIRLVVRRWFELARLKPLGDFATRRRCVAAFKRLVLDAKLGRPGSDFGVSLFEGLRRQLEDSGVELKAILEQERFVEFVALVAGLTEPRRRLIAGVFNHPLYSELISSVVYQALVNYLIQDNLISQRVPGVGSMLKLGRRVATRAVPGLDATLERQLKGYIKGYLPSLIRTSERFVDALATDDALLDRAAEAWPEIGSVRLAAVVDGVAAEDAERILGWVRGFGDELRRTEWFLDLGETLIAQVFERYGDEPLAVLLEDFGIRRGMVNKELLAFGPPLLRELREAGFLGEILRVRLAPFYESEAVTELLGSKPPR